MTISSPLLASNDAERQFHLRFMGEATATCNHASFHFQYNQCWKISQRPWQETESRGSWALRLSVSFIVIQLYKFFNLTNYFYREILENKNATFHDNGTLSFVPHRYSIPIPERSVGDPHKDIIVTANLPLLGISSATLQMSTFAALAFSTLAKSTNAQPILNLTVHDYLWGYKDSLVSLANGVLPNYINFETFGLMDRVSLQKKNKKLD